MISTVTNENLYEYRGTKAEFEAVKTDIAFNKPIGSGSMFLAVDEDTGTCYVFMLHEDSTSHTKTWIELK